MILRISLLIICFPKFLPSYGYYIIATEYNPSTNSYNEISGKDFVKTSMKPDSHYITYNDYTSEKLSDKNRANNLVKENTMSTTVSLLYHLLSTQETQLTIVPVDKNSPEYMNQVSIKDGGQEKKTKVKRDEPTFSSLDTRSELDISEGETDYLQESGRAENLDYAKRINSGNPGEHYVAPIAGELSQTESIQIEGKKEYVYPATAGTPEPDVGMIYEELIFGEYVTNSSKKYSRDKVKSKTMKVKLSAIGDSETTTSSRLHVPARGDMDYSEDLDWKEYPNYIDNVIYDSDNNRTRVKIQDGSNFEQKGKHNSFNPSKNNNFKEKTDTRYYEESKRKSPSLEVSTLDTQTPIHNYIEGLTGSPGNKSGPKEVIHATETLLSLTVPGIVERAVKEQINKRRRGELRPLVQEYDPPIQRPNSTFRSKYRFLEEKRRQVNCSNKLERGLRCNSQDHVVVDDLQTPATRKAVKEGKLQSSAIKDILRDFLIRNKMRNQEPLVGLPETEDPLQTDVAVGGLDQAVTTDDLLNPVVPRSLADPFMNGSPIQIEQNSKYIKINLENLDSPDSPFNVEDLPMLITILIDKPKSFVVDG